jgi:hypothetical protein
MDWSDGAGPVGAAGTNNPKDYRHLDKLQIISAATE